MFLSSTLVASPSLSSLGNDWEINKEELTLGRELGSGEFWVSTFVVPSMNEQSLHVSLVHVVTW